MYPDGYSYRAIVRNPFTGEHGVATFPASHYGRVPLSCPIDLPKSDLALAYQDRTTADYIPIMMLEITF